MDEMESLRHTKWEASSRAPSKHHNSDFRNCTSFARDIARDVLIHGNVDWRLGARCTLDAEGGYNVGRTSTPCSPRSRQATEPVHVRDFGRLQYPSFSSQRYASAL